MPVSGKEVIKRLKKLGWTMKSQRGSHIKLIKRNRMTIVPLHGNHDLGRGLVKKIEKDTEEKIL